MVKHLSKKAREKEITKLALETFGNEEKANEWLNTPHSLFAETPLNHIRTAEGFEDIKKVLIAISYGLCI